jgi:hypothetical protein
VQLFKIVPFDIPPTLDPTNIYAMFSLEGFLSNFTYAIAGAGAIGLVSLLLRQNTYALYAPMIFAVGAFIPLVNNFLFAIPNTIRAIVSIFPNLVPGGFTFPLGDIVIDPYSVVVLVIQAVLGYLFIMGVVTQREIQ